jgi:hypothetical protein
MAKRYWRPPPGYYDEHRRRAVADIAAKLPALVDNRDEEGYVLILKKWFPEMKPEDLIERIKRFRAAVAEKHGDR